jgi:DNA-binding beta-propeller fold protein YncE
MQPDGIAYDAVNNLLYVADCRHHVVRVIDIKTNNISTFAGVRMLSGMSGDGKPKENCFNYVGGLATNAKLSNPAGVAVDSVNNLVYIADGINHLVRVVNRSTNIITTFAGVLGSFGSHDTAM